MTSNLAQHSADLIFGRGLITAETICDELRSRLVNRLAHHFYSLSPDQLLLLARETLESFEPLLAATLADTQLAAWVRGLEIITTHTPRRALELLLAAKPPPESTAGLLAPPFFELTRSGPHIPSTTFPALEAAVDRLIDKGIVTKDIYAAQDAECQLNSFTVAGLASEDAIHRVRNALVQQIHSGGSLTLFREQLATTIAASQLSSAHVETIYRTGVQRAYAEGQETMHANPIIHSVFPYARYDAIHDGRVRDEHRALETLGLNGTNIFRADDPVWRYFTPPWGFNCRCSKTFLTVKQAARAGVLEARHWDRTGAAPDEPQWRLDAIAFRPTDGFVSPGMARAA